MTVGYTVTKETMGLIVKIINQNELTALSRDCMDLHDLRDLLVSDGHIQRDGDYHCAVSAD